MDQQEPIQDFQLRVKNKKNFARRNIVTDNENDRFKLKNNFGQERSISNRNLNRVASVGEPHHLNTLGEEFLNRREIGSAMNLEAS
jgi:hypothetical protein